MGAKYSPERNPPKKRESDLASIFWDLSQSDKLSEIKPLLPDTSVKNVLCNSWSSADYFLFLPHLKVKTTFLETFVNFKPLNMGRVRTNCRRACGHGDVGTCPHQDLTATLTIWFPGGAYYAHHILMSLQSFENQGRTCKGRWEGCQGHHCKILHWGYRAYVKNVLCNS